MLHWPVWVSPSPFDLFRNQRFSIRTTHGPSWSRGTKKRWLKATVGTVSNGWNFHTFIVVVSTCRTCFFFFFHQCNRSVWGWSINVAEKNMGLPCQWVWCSSKCIHPSCVLFFIKDIRVPSQSKQYPPLVLPPNTSGGTKESPGRVAAPQGVSRALSAKLAYQPAVFVERNV